MPIARPEEDPLSDPVVAGPAAHPRSRHRPRVPQRRLASCDEAHFAPAAAGIMRSRATPFGMTVRAALGVVVVELRGELDILAESRLTPRMDLLTRQGQPDIVLDLRRITFMDASGLRLLLRARSRVLANGGTLQVVPDTRWVVRLLRLTRAGFGFSLLENLPPALATEGPSGVGCALVRAGSGDRVLAGSRYARIASVRAQQR